MDSVEAKVRGNRLHRLNKVPLWHLFVKTDYETIFVSIRSRSIPSRLLLKKRQEENSMSYIIILPRYNNTDIKYYICIFATAPNMDYVFYKYEQACEITEGSRALLVMLGYSLEVKFHITVTLP